MSALVEHRADSDDDPASAAPDSDVAVSDELESDVAGSDVAGSVAAGQPDRVASDPADGAPAPEPAPLPRELRIDFGAHFEAHYPRLVAQLYAITLDAAVAHDAVQDAYAQAWRRWATVGRSRDPTAWVRGVAVRSTIRSWRAVLGRLGFGRPRPDRGGVQPRTAALLSALRRMPIPERRAIVLTYMAGSSIEEIAAVEQVSVSTAQARLSRGRRLITENLADDLPAVLGAPPPLGEHGVHGEGAW